jgi:peptidyl-tRNA hydrolase
MDDLIKGDPNALVMYLVVREGINISRGKFGAQIGHAVCSMTMRYHQLDKQLDGFFSAHCPGEECSHREPPADLLLKVADFQAWYNKSGQRKIVKTADDKEWAKLKAEFEGKEIEVIADAGLSELEPGTETCLALWPMRKCDAPKIVQRLQVMKEED